MSEFISKAKAVQYVLSIRARFYKWLFGTPTTVIEALNGMLLFAWGVAIMDDKMVSISLYAGFLGPSVVRWNECVSMMFFIVSSLAVVGAVKKGPRADRISGYALQLGAVLWLCVAVNFFASFPPLNTGMLTYSIFAMFCWMAGNQLWVIGGIEKERQAADAAARESE